MSFADRVRALCSDLSGTIDMNTASRAAGCKPAADALRAFDIDRAYAVFSSLGGTVKASSFFGRT